MARFSSQVVAVEPHAHAGWLAAQGLAAMTARPLEQPGVVVVRGRGFVGRQASGVEDELGWRTLGGGAAVGTLAPVAVDGWGDAPRSPAAAVTAVGPLAVGWAGGLVNRDERAAAAMAGGAALHDGSDSELLLALVAASSQRTLVNRLVDVAWGLRGAFGVVIAATDCVVGLRDAHGLGRLVVGVVDGASVLASDAAALYALAAADVRELAPGELIVCAGGKATSLHPLSRRPPTRCALAALGLASDAHPTPVGNASYLRNEVGRVLARLHPAEASVVVAADAPSLPVAMGFAEVAGLNVAPWVGGAAVALSPWVSARGVVVVAAVDGRGAADVCAQALTAGAHEVHLRVGSGAVKRACPYGVEVDPPALTTEVVSVAWLGGAGLRALTGEGWCHACADEAWPVPPEGDGQLSLFHPTS